jgi:hypothetical protein
LAEDRNQKLAASREEGRSGEAEPIGLSDWVEVFMKLAVWFAWFAKGAMGRLEKTLAEIYEQEE